MKRKCLWGLMVLLLGGIASCGQKERVNQEMPLSETILAEAERSGTVLQGEVIPIDTVLFRYAYRIRVQGETAVVMDLHNKEYFFHVFTYPAFRYVASFGRRGEGPDEMQQAAGGGFTGASSFCAFDDAKGRFCSFSDITVHGAPVQLPMVSMDKGLTGTHSCCVWDDSTMLVSDATGERRCCWASLSSGKLLRKSEAKLPVDDEKLQEGVAPMTAQGWNTYFAGSPDRRYLAAVAQFGDCTDLYDLRSGKEIRLRGADGEPVYASQNGYSYPTGRMGHFDVQMTDRYLYTLYDGREFKEIMRSPDTYQQGGRIVRRFSMDGELLATWVLDRPIAGLYVDEATGILYGTDVNADEQLVKWKLEF